MNQSVSLHTPLVFNNNWRTDELNSRIASRLYPDLVIPQSISPQPTETRQTVFGKSVDPRNLDKNVAAINGFSLAASSIHDNFICGDGGEPLWFLANIDTESVLRNQTFALQKDCPQSTYMPASNSELYRPTVPINSGPILEQPHPFLFERTRFSKNIRHPRDSATTDTRNGFIRETGSAKLDHTTKRGQRNFYAIDRASLSQPFA